MSGARILCTKEDRYRRPCPNDAVPGDNRCAHHGGREGSSIASRRQRLAVTHARDYVVTDIGSPRWVDPGYALLEEVAQSAGHVAFLRKKVEELEESQLVWIKVLEAEEEKSGGGETGDYTLRRTEAKAEINRWWQMYQEERKHLASVSATALKAGVEERRLRLAERAADALDDMLGGLLMDLGLDPAAPAVRAIVSNRLGNLLASDWMGATEGGTEVSTARSAAKELPMEAGEGPIAPAPVERW